MSNEQIAFTTIQKGSYCGMRFAKNVEITNKKQWEAFWSGFCTLVPTPEAPAIDFRKQLVLAVFMGQQTSGGYSIEISSVERSDGMIIASIKNTRASGMVTMALSQPFHIISIPRKRGLLKFQPAQQERPSQSTGAMLGDPPNKLPDVIRRTKTYILMLDVKTYDIPDGERQALLQATSSALVSFRKLLADFLAENKLTEQVKIEHEFSAIGGLVISTTSDIAERIRTLEGVDSMAEDGPSFSNSRGII